MKSRFQEATINYISDERGELGILQTGSDIPFTVKRVYFIRNVPAQIARGFHAHKKLQQLLICIAGTVDILLESGDEQRCFNLAPTSSAIYLNGLVWREMRNFSEDAILLVLCDREFSEDDYIRDYALFKELV